MTETATLEQPKNPFSSCENGECFGFAVSAVMARRVLSSVDAGSLCGTRGAVLHGELGAVVNSGNPDASRPAILNAVVSPSMFPDQLARFGSSNFRAHHSSALNPVCSI